MKKIISLFFVSIFFVLGCENSSITNTDTVNKTNSNTSNKQDVVEFSKDIIKEPPNYDFPLTITVSNSLTLPNSKILYRINPDGNFYYTNEDNNFLNRMLSNQELTEVRNLLEILNFSKLTETPIRVGHPPIEPPKHVDSKGLSLIVKNKSTYFYYKNSSMAFTNEYYIAWSKLESKLEELKNQTKQLSNNIYSFPIKVIYISQCDISQNLYEIYDSGVFAYNSESTANSDSMNYRILSGQEILGLKNLLKNIDIAELDKNNTIVTGSIQENSIQQNKDCSKTKVISLFVNGVELHFYENDRFYTNDKTSDKYKEYTKALKLLDSHIEKLYVDSKSNSTNKISDKYTYSLPLKFGLNSNMCGLDDKKIYEITPEGSFSYLDSKNKINIRQLANYEIDYIKDILTSLNIESLAEYNSKKMNNIAKNEDCKSIKYFDINVNGYSKKYDYDDKNYSIEYKNAFKSLENLLKSLSEEL